MIEERMKLYEMCDPTETSRSGIDFFVNCYMESLHWNEEKACVYALGLVSSQLT